MAANEAPHPHCKRLVLDAGPLLSLSPLRGLAETYVTVPQVLVELKDGRAREHFERLGLLSGVKIEVRSPDAVSLAHAVQWAKKTGDYSVLSHADMCVLALTYMLSEEDKKEKERRTTTTTEEVLASEGVKNDDAAETCVTVTVEDATPQELADELEKSVLTDKEEIQTDYGCHPAEQHSSARESDVLQPLNVEITQIQRPTQDPARYLSSASSGSPTPLYDDPSDEDDGEGEWITPSNVALHKSRVANLLPQNNTKVRGKKATAIASGCMTGDFAMQNVLLQMDLNLVGLEGKRIERIRSWVLRCHACFKICKDNSKKFCPSCGNPTLLRTSVTVSTPGSSADTSIMKVHLKPNFQYKTRGTKYSIPAPKAGSAKTGPGTGLILREDQIEYMRAKKKAESKREREERKLTKGIMKSGVDGRAVSSWMDPDWVPEIISVGSGGQGRTNRSSRMDGDMPQVGYGRKNPNEKRRK